MAADSNKQSASDTKTLSTVQVGSGGQVQPGRFASPKTSKKLLLYALAAAIVLGGGWLILSDAFHVGQKVYAQAAGHKVYKEDINNLVGKTKGVSNHDAAKVLADEYLSQAMAKKAGLTVTDGDLVAQYPDINSKGTTKFARQSETNTVYFNHLSAYNAGLYKGQLVVANFSRHIAFQSPFLAIQEASDPLMGNPTAIAQDKQYANNFINKLYDQVKSGQITFDQAIDMEHNDPQLGLSAYRSLPHSGSFDTSNVYLGGTALILPDSIQSIISNLKAGQISKPFVVRVNNSLTQKNVTTESYYLMVKMDSTKGGHSGLTYAQYLAQSKQQLGYKIYV